MKRGKVDHIKMGRGGAQGGRKLRDKRAGHIVDKSAQAGARFQMARVENTPAQYLYPDGDLHYFMNTETFDQFPVSKDLLGDALNFLVENGSCELRMYGDEAVGIQLPAAVELEVAQTDPWVRGDTAQGGTKPAKRQHGSMAAGPRVTPRTETRKSAARRTGLGTRALARMALLGTQRVQSQSPPMRAASMRTTLMPMRAANSEAGIPAEPPPIIARS